jgi:hypothetical protein
MNDDCFRDPQQRSEACRALLATGELGHFWSDLGPTEEARSLAGNPSKLPAGDRALLLAAMAFWTGKPVPLRFDELIGLEEAEPICKLTTAASYGPSAVDVWLTRSDDVEGFVATPQGVHAAAAELYDEARAVLAEGASEAINFSAAPDACALGASRVAEYVLATGVAPIRKDKKRYAEATKLTVHVLGLYAAMERKCAAGFDDQDEAGGQGADDDEVGDDGPTTTE